MKPLRRSQHISRCLELAILLEASAHKPGNVNVVTNFEKTRYEHFLASAVAAAPHFKYAADRGMAVSEGAITLSNVGVGAIIRDCVAEIAAWQHGGNTLLGTVILFVPMAVAAGVVQETSDLSVDGIRRNLKHVVESTTPQDAVDLYDAIEIAKPSGLGKAPDLDLTDPTSKNRILEEKTSLYAVFKIAEKYDTICSEWVNNYPVTFDIAYPSLSERLGTRVDPSAAIVQTFLEVLAQIPDTFIARKTSMEKAQEISSRTQEILKLGGVQTPNGRTSLHKFDEELRSQDSLLNPGTTADIIAAALAICTLMGYRP